jgi:SulP family sulfate permease
MRPLIPFIAWPPVNAETLRADALAGVTVALLAIPQALAYAQLAGMPAFYGLYAALVPTVVGAVWGSSRVLSTGPVAMTSLLTAASIAPLAAAGSDQYIAYAILLALLSGLFQVAFGMLRMGVLLNFLSHPVLMGFINAAAIVITLSQLPALLGIASQRTGSLLLDTLAALRQLPHAHLPSVAFGLGTIVALVVLRRAVPRLPGVLLVVAVLTAASYAMGFAAGGGQVVGTVPSGLPEPALPRLDLEAVRLLLPAAFVIALMSFMEAMSSCKIIALKTRTAWDENQELVGQGLAKIAGAFTQAMPVSGSFSRSAVNLGAGARTGVSSIVAAGAVLLTLLAFTPLLHHLPSAVLAGVIVAAVSGLVNYRAILDAWRASRDDGITATVTFVTTLGLAPDIQVGILAGILLSLALVMFRMMRPRVAVLGLHEDGTLRDAALYRLPALHPQLGAVRFDGSLYFMSVSYFEDAIVRLEQENPDMRYLLVVAGGVNDIDASGVEMLGRLVERLHGNGITLGLSGVKRQVREVLARTGLEEKIRAENFFPGDQSALTAILPRLERP